jgi:hypothetical protein
LASLQTLILCKCKFGKFGANSRANLAIFEVGEYLPDFEYSFIAL